MSWNRNEKQTRATLKGHYCLYYLTMSHIKKPYRPYASRISYRVPKLIFSRESGGGAYLKGGAYYKFWALRGALTRSGALSWSWALIRAFTLFVISSHLGKICAGLKITAGQRTMSGLIVDLTGQTLLLPVILTGHFGCEHFIIFSI